MIKVLLTAIAAITLTYLAIVNKKDEITNSISDTINKSKVHQHVQNVKNEIQQKESEMNDTPIYDAWGHWKQKYSKQYGAQDDQQKFQIFKENYKTVSNHHEKFIKGEVTYDLGLNQFSDLSNQEFKDIYMGLHKQNPKKLYNYVELNINDDDLPREVDWRTKGAVSPIKNQGQCGSCWAFSTIGALEGLHQIKRGSLVEFSEQQLVDCSQEYGNNGCNGGLMDHAFDYIKDNGITTEDKYPYKAVVQDCKYDKSEEVYQISSWIDVPQNSTKQLMAAVAQQPIAVAIDAEGMEFQQYKGGVYTAECGTSLDHGVLIVGYGTEDGQTYWLIRNSWGTVWGEEGYMKMKRQDSESSAGECGIKLAASYPSDIGNAHNIKQESNY